MYILFPLWDKTENPPNISRNSDEVKGRQNIPRTRDDKTDINDYEKKCEDSEVNVLHCSPQLPMDKFFVTSSHWRLSWIIALCKNDDIYNIPSVLCCVINNMY